MPRPFSRPIRTLILIVLAVCCPHASEAQYLSHLDARASDPLFATYAAPLERSQFIVDEGYHFRFYVDDEPVAFITDSAGSLGLAFQRDGAVTLRPREMARAPVVTASYSDVVRYRMRPYDDLLVEAHFQVHSSRFALHDIRITNTGSAPLAVHLHPYLAHRVDAVELAGDGQAVTFRHAEPADNWTVTHGVPYAPTLRNVYLASGDSRATGARSTDATVNGALVAALDLPASDSMDVVAFQYEFNLAPGATEQLRIVRGVADARSPSPDLRIDAEKLLEYDVDAGLREAEQRYAGIPSLSFDDPAQEATYWNAFSLMTQVMLPPEGQSSYNYYVFSREPTWGWGHGGQVFHESLTMLAYAFMDPKGAMDSQRVYMERQHRDGYINYRTGGYLNETITTDGERTSSAPWYSWINWELYRITGDQDFLEDAYTSGAAYYGWWQANRDRDGDGLAEWGGHAVLESVRDGQVAVWDDVAWPEHFEAVDLNSMLVVEARSLAHMARTLGNTSDAARWEHEADRRAERIRSLFWDEETGFYYHVDRDDHDFSFERPGDLKRQEIIGFLPLWAGIASEDQAARLVEHLTDGSKFWRPNGIPSLAADDPSYDPMGYWNGPVWVEWQYLIFRGLLDYGYRDAAEELADRVVDHVAHHLAESHTFWELYSPDALEAGHHQTYIWTGLVARMMLDLRAEE